MMGTVPRKIYLQWHGADESEIEWRKDLGLDTAAPADEVTWCKDQITDYDVEYVRADLAQMLIRALNDIVLKGAHQGKSGEILAEIAANNLHEFSKIYLEL